MFTGETKSGFKFEISENSFDDMRVVDALAAISEGENPLAISELVMLLLGKKQRDALYKHLKRADGTVPPGKVVDEIVEIVQLKSKNS